MKNRFIAGAVDTTKSKGLWKVILGSFLAFFVAWGITFLSSENAAEVFGKYAWIIPTLLGLFKFIQTYYNLVKKQSE